MNVRRSTLVVGISATLLVAGAAASAPGDEMSAVPFEFAQSTANRAVGLFATLDDDFAVPAGTIDDGRELLPSSSIGLQRAIASALGAVPGATSQDVGEVDLEYVSGTLVFNVDIGEKDVKVDASTGDVLSIDQDD